MKIGIHYFYHLQVSPNIEKWATGFSTIPAMLKEHYHNFTSATLLEFHIEEDALCQTKDQCSLLQCCCSLDIFHPSPSALACSARALKHRKEAAEAIS